MGEVESGAAGLQRQEEYLDLARLEAIYEFLAGGHRYAAVQEQRRDVPRPEVLFDSLQVVTKGSELGPTTVKRKGGPTPREVFAEFFGSKEWSTDPTEFLVRSVIGTDRVHDGLVLSDRVAVGQTVRRRPMTSR